MFHHSENNSDQDGGAEFLLSTGTHATASHISPERVQKGQCPLREEDSQIVERTRVNARCEFRLEGARTMVVGPFSFLWPKGGRERFSVPTHNVHLEEKHGWARA